MIYQATEVVNFAQGAMAMFSTYLCWSLLQLGLSYWVAFLATLVIAFVGGLLIERIVLRQETVDRLHRTGLVRALRSAAGEHDANSPYVLKRVLPDPTFIRYLRRSGGIRDRL